MKLSIIIPVFNEEKTVSEVIKRVEELSIPNIIKEIIIVNDGSTDKTHAAILSAIKDKKDIIYHQHKRNQGKGLAVISGITQATGEYVTIQDADLEYNPEFFKNLLKPILEGKTDVVYGTRLHRLPHLDKEEGSFRFLLHYFGNRGLSFIASLLYGQWITDIETCYKIFPRLLLKGKKMRARGFEFEPEITAIILKNKHKIIEIPIQTTPRGYSEGKKLNTFKDGWLALRTLVLNRFIS